MKRKALIIPFVLALTLALMPPSSAENTDQKTFQSQVVAEHVLIGKVKNVESRWNDDRTLIYSYVTISVEDWLTKSCCDKEVTVKYIGGEVDGLGSWRSDQPSFSMDERVKVFLKLDETGEFAVVGGRQGKISLSSPASSGYSYSGIHWDSDSLPVEYYINELGTPDTTGESTAVQRAFQTWEDDLGSYMDYTYMGTTTKNVDAYDGYNIVFWKNIDGPGGTLAYCHYWYYTSSKEMVEFNIVFDEAETWSATGEPTKFDVQDLGTHEVGHTLSLNDLYDPADSEETMYGYASAGETKKSTLNTGDIAGIRHIYPGSMVTYAIATNPIGLKVEVDGSSYTAPKLFSWYPNATHTIYAQDLQSGGTGVRYLYTSWSDGGSRLHIITVGSSNTTITATYKTQYYLNTSSLYGIMSGAGWYDSGSTAYATLGAGIVYGGVGTRYVFTGWSGDASGANYARSNPIFMNEPKAAVANWKTQHQVSFKFMTNSSEEIYPPQIKILGAPPNNTLTVLKFYSKIWLDNVEWTVEQILWKSINVVADPNPKYLPTALGTWTIYCRIYSLTVYVKDYLTMAVSDADVRIYLPNGTLFASEKSGAGGKIAFPQLPISDYKVDVTFLGLKTSAALSLTSNKNVEIKIFLSVPMLLIIVMVVGVSIGGILWKYRKRHG